MPYKDKINRYKVFKSWSKRNRDKINSYNRIQRAKIKEEVIKAYGNKCICCGESTLEFLTIDHIYNDGYMEKTKWKRSGTTFYLWLYKNNFPKDRYQLLCANCNQGKRLNKGICPHKAMESETPKQV